MSEAIRVVLADDHPIFRKGLRLVLEDAPGITVVAEADNGDAALACVTDLQPHVAILDLDMPGRDGIAVAHAVRDRGLPVQLILLTAHKSEALINRALDAGLHGYLLKDAAVTEVVDCVRQVRAGQSYVSPRLSTVLLKRRVRDDAFRSQHPQLERLSPTERRVIGLVAGGKTSREIADLLFISVRTVEHHRANISVKLELRGSSALVKFAIAHRSELSRPTDENP